MEKKPLEIFIYDLPIRKMPYSWVKLRSFEGTGLFRKLRSSLAERHSEPTLYFECEDGNVIFERNQWGGYDLKELLFNWGYHPLVHHKLDFFPHKMWTHVRFENGAVHGRDSVRAWDGNNLELLLSIDHEKGMATKYSYTDYALSLAKR